MVLVLLENVFDATMLLFRYDASKGMESLDLTWVSRANALQRKGRAGRVAEGVCFHLFTSNQFDYQFREQPIPGTVLFCFLLSNTGWLKQSTTVSLSFRCHHTKANISLFLLQKYKGLLLNRSYYRLKHWKFSEAEMLRYIYLLFNIFKYYNGWSLLCSTRIHFHLHEL